MAALIQFIHPYPHRSRVNRALIDAVRTLPNVVVNDLYARYPNLHVDVEREQDLLRSADTVIFQHPLYWYSGPALLKEWIDVVLDQGFAYGPEGTLLQGKAWLHSVTTGMPEAAYTAGGINRTTMAELLRPFECTAEFCGMRWLDPLILHEAHDVDEHRIAGHAERLRSLIFADNGPDFSP
jgi:glutathione-regulated potassium-efflux system ancillary protein KefG